MEMRTEVVLDVEGVLYKTSLRTLQAVPHSLLWQMVNEDWKEQIEETGRVFVDRDSSVFPVILSFLRDGQSIPLPSDDYFLARIAHEARYFGLSTLASLAEQKRERVGGELTPPPTREECPIPTKKSTSKKKTSISLPRNFSHIAHVGWTRDGLCVAGRASDDNALRAIAKAAKEAPQGVYDLVDGCGHTVKVMLGAKEMRPPLPPFRPPPINTIPQST